MQTSTKKHKSEVATERYERIYNFFQKNHVAVLSIVDKDKKPHGSVIYCSVDEHFIVTFTTKKNTYKYDNLLLNKDVSLLIYNSESQTTAIMTGVAEEIKDEEEIGRIVNNMIRSAQDTSESGVAPLSKLLAGGYVAFQIKPSHISMADYSRPDPGGYELYETIEF